MTSVSLKISDQWIWFMGLTLQYSKASEVIKCASNNDSDELYLQITSHEM